MEFNLLEIGLEEFGYRARLSGDQSWEVGHGAQPREVGLLKLGFGCSAIELGHLEIGYGVQPSGDRLLNHRINKFIPKHI